MSDGKLEANFVTREHFVKREEFLWQKLRGKFTDKARWLAEYYDPCGLNLEADELAFLMGHLHSSPRSVKPMG